MSTTEATPEADPALTLATAADVMKSSPRTCSPFSTVTEAVLIFKDEDCGMVPIVDQGRPVGVVTDRDVALSLASTPDVNRQPVTEIMTTDPVSVRTDTPLTEVVRLFMDRAIRRVLVIDDKGQLAGVISWSDLSPYLSYEVTGRIVAETLDRPST